MFDFPSSPLNTRFPRRFTYLYQIYIAALFAAFATYLQLSQRIACARARECPKCFTCVLCCASSPSSSFAAHLMRVHCILLGAGWQLCRRARARAGHPADTSKMSCAPRARFLLLVDEARARYGAFAWFVQRAWFGESTFCRATKKKQKWFTKQPGNVVFCI